MPLGLKKFICVRCGLIEKRHNYAPGMLCKKCDAVVGKDVMYANKLQEAGLPIPDRLMYLYKTQGLKLKEE